MIRQNYLSILTTLLLVMDSMIGVNAFAAASGTITTSTPLLVVANGVPGTATISWTSSGATNPVIRVSVNGGTEWTTPFSTSANGVLAAPFIWLPSYYVFTLYDGTVALASTRVTAVTGTITTSSPTLVIAQGSTASATISWSNSGITNPNVRVSTNGGSDANNTVSTPLSTQYIAICSSPNYYIFTLYSNSTPLASTLVNAQLGTITTSNPHLAIATGATASATIAWRCAGAANPNVRVSTNGSLDTTSTVSTAINSQYTATCSSPNYYVYTLYDGNTPLSWTSITTQPMPTSQFGINYWPTSTGSGGCSVLYNANWTSGQKAIIAADLDLMSSLSVDVLRITFLPELSGFNLSGKSGNTYLGGTLTSQYTELTTNLPAFLGMCAARGLRVEVTFGQDYLFKNDQGQQWWTGSYPSIDAFVRGSTTSSSTMSATIGAKDWINGIVTAIENSPYRNTVFYYDYFNEFSSLELNHSDYIKCVYDSTNVPKGKRGVSVLTGVTDAAPLYSTLGSRRIDYIEYHTYGTASVTAGHNQCLNTFPQATVVLGEFGATATSSSEEAAQQSFVLDHCDDAITGGIPYFLHWSLWDTPLGKFGWGYSYHSSKNVMGGVAAELGLLTNADMESISNRVPIGWRAGGNGTLASMTNASDCATNASYARISTSTSSGAVWLYQWPVKVVGGKTLYTNAFIRSNMRNISLFVYEYDSNGTFIRSQVGPSFTPSAWSWYNYLQTVGSSSFPMTATTSQVNFGILGQCIASPSYLDVDTTSAWQHDLK